MLVVVSCKTTAISNRGSIEKKRVVYFDVPNNHTLRINEVVIIKVPTHKDGRFINNSVDKITQLILMQENLIQIKISIKLNSNSNFNKRYSESLKSDLIKKISSKTNLVLGMDYSIIAIGSSENLLILGPTSTFVEMPSRIEVKLM